MKLKLFYPIENKTNIIQESLKKLKIVPIKCEVCGKLTFALNHNPENLRESLNCHNCNSTTRQRQMAKLICNKFGISSLNQISGIKKKIYNTESSGPIHNKLLKAKNYYFSEYFGENYKSGEKVNGIRNENLNHLSFKNETFDLVLSSDVFEHIATPFKAHGEVYRVLKKGGCHIFTVPFLKDKYLNENRAIIKNNKTIHLMEPIYHLDGIRPENGILVYNIFSLEMLIKLKKIGFDTQMYLAITNTFGINIDSSPIFCSIKTIL